MLLWRQAFEKDLKHRLGENLELTWTQNRRVMISFERKNGAPMVRLNESFASADDKLKKDLLDYLTKVKAKVPASIKEFIETISADREEELEKIDTKGNVYDLMKIYKKLNKVYFEGNLKGRITWGRRFFAPRKRSIVFGSYMSGIGIIRIHPVLDTQLVPPFYIESVVYHEMVHEHIDTMEGDGKGNPLHSDEFRELERRFKGHQLALAWEKSHLGKLLKYMPENTEP